MSIDHIRYELARQKILGGSRQNDGIGTLREKTVHAVLKNYYQPEVTKQEVPVMNMVADIFDGDRILEIQTRNLYSLKNKLETFLPHYPVTIIHPLPREKWVICIDPQTGEIGKKRKSPKIGTVYDAFKELVRIKEYLDHERLTIKLVFLNMEEYRLLDGWSRDRKRGSHRHDRIPMEFVEEIEFGRKEDYLQLVPYGIEEPFSVKDFARMVKIRPERAGQVINVLFYLQQIERMGKKGNAYLYRVIGK